MKVKIRRCFATDTGAPQAMPHSERYVKALTGVILRLETELNAKLPKAREEKLLKLLADAHGLRTFLLQENELRLPH